jgi:type III restriction enzyme
MIELKNYQERAVDKLRSDVDGLLNYGEGKICVFKAPTGSGKTIMVAEFLKRLVTQRTDDKEICFIWISVNKLHDQSKDKLDKYYEDSRVIKCSEFEDLEDKQIGQNEMLFFNWQSINKKGNIYIRENEQENNLSNIVANTKEAGRSIVLIIDESHHTAKAEKSREVIEAINPNVTIEVSATPQITNMSSMVTVEFQDVKDEGMIKSEVAINPEIDKIKPDGKTADDLVIAAALKKREELKKAYKKEGSNVNPLVLIQLPDAKKGVVDRREDIEKILKDKFKITTENRKLAIYLSDKDSKINLENIEKTDNETEVLIFKQAIAIGWDCPRASILVLFRDWKSMTFSIQTVGRIMRMAEFKHYTNDELNKGYVFTNLADVNIATDIAKDYITIYEAKRRNDIYKNIDLHSVYLKRQREKTRLSGQFSKIFLKVAQKDRFHKEVNMKPKALTTNIMVDGVVENIDEAKVITHKGEIDVDLTSKELQNRFDMFVYSACSPYAPSDSMGRIKTALYKFFSSELKLDDYDKSQIIVLGEDNIDKFRDIINKAKEEYKKVIVEQVAEQREIQHLVWNVPTLISHNSRYKEGNYTKSIMKPCFVKPQSNPEVEFVKLLEEKGNKVKWWYQNGEVEPKYFAIEYTDDKGFKRSFYLDFIVTMKDGSIGLFDTKSGMTAKTATEKAEALAKYIKDQNKKYKRKLWGGIVVFKDGSCRYNDAAKYSFEPKNLGNDWKFLSFK